MIFGKKNNLKLVIGLLLIILVLIVVCIYLSLDRTNNKSKQVLKIDNKMVHEKYNSLVNVLGKPNYIEKDSNNNLHRAVWQSPLDNFNGFGKYGGSDLIAIYGKPSKKYHPHPANLFVILGKYMKVPEHLFGPLKYASETINIEQLFIPEKYSMKYYNTGIKTFAMVTGSCASITISAITIRFVEEMIEKYKDVIKSLELYKEFRYEYDRRIDDYLCGRGITDPIPWFDHNYFEEGETAYLGDKICKPTNNANSNNANSNNVNSNNVSLVENFSHYPECRELMEDENFCKDNPEQKCC